MEFMIYHGVSAILLNDFQTGPLVHGAFHKAALAQFFILSGIDAFVRMTRMRELVVQHLIS